MKNSAKCRQQSVPAHSDGEQGQQSSHVEEKSVAVPSQELLAVNKQNNVVAGPDLNMFYRLDPLTLKFCADKKDWSHAKLIAGLILQSFIEYREKLEIQLLSTNLQRR